MARPIGDEALSEEAASRSLALLTRWALRNAQERKPAAGKVITVDFAKGSEPKSEENQLDASG